LGDLFVSCKSGCTITDKYQPVVDYLAQNSYDPAIFENQNQSTKSFLLNGTMNETGRAVHGCLGTLKCLNPYNKEAFRNRKTSYLIKWGVFLFL
jgi:hypothetical protein